jgi:hypothetical protein
MTTIYKSDGRARAVRQRYFVLKVLSVTRASNATVMSSHPGS